MPVRQTSDSIYSVSNAARIDMRMELIDRDIDPDGMTDDELVATYRDKVSDVLPDGVEREGSPADDVVSAPEKAPRPDSGNPAEGTGDSETSDSAPDAPSDGAPSPYATADGDTPRPDSSSPMEDMVRQIARAEDDWRSEHEIAPAFVEITARVNAATGVMREQVSDLHKRIDNVEANGTGAAATTVTVKRPDVPDVTVENAHPILADVVRALSTGVHLMLVGPAGSGKTTIAEQAFDALGREWCYCGAVHMEYKLTGHKGPTGEYYPTEFYDAFVNGKGMILDELDGYSPTATLAVNGALANGVGDFAGTKAERHDDFLVCGTANTYSRGADREYVGRNQLDAAFLDRFVVMEVDYDETVEAQWSGNADWTAKVQAWRHAKDALKVRHVIGVRASIHGAKLLAAGFDDERVAEMTVWKGLDQATVGKIREHAKV